MTEELTEIEIITEFVYYCHCCEQEYSRGDIVLFIDFSGNETIYCPYCEAELEEDERVKDD